MLNKIASKYLNHLSTINNKISNFVLPNFPSDVRNTTRTAKKAQANTQPYSEVPLVDPSLAYVGTYRDPAQNVQDTQPSNATTAVDPSPAYEGTYHDPVQNVQNAQPAQPQPFVDPGVTGPVHPGVDQEVQQPKTGNPFYDNLSPAHKKIYDEQIRIHGDAGLAENAVRRKQRLAEETKHRRQNPNTTGYGIQLVQR